MSANTFLEKYKNNIEKQLLSASKLKPGELVSKKITTYSKNITKNIPQIINNQLNKEIPISNKFNVENKKIEVVDNKQIEMMENKTIFDSNDFSNFPEQELSSDVAYLYKEKENFVKKEEILPLEEEIPFKEEVLPLEEEISFKEEVLPLEEKIPFKEEVLPLEEEIPFKEEVLPLEEEIPFKEEVLPLEEEIPFKEEVLPLEEEIPFKEELLPLEEEIPFKEEVLPLEEEIPFKEEVLPLEEEISFKEEVLPLEEEIPFQEEKNIELSMSEIDKKDYGSLIYNSYNIEIEEEKKEKVILKEVVNKSINEKNKNNSNKIDKDVIKINKENVSFDKIDMTSEVIENILIINKTVKEVKYVMNDKNYNTSNIKAVRKAKKESNFFQEQSEKIIKVVKMVKEGIINIIDKDTIIKNNKKKYIPEWTEQKLEKKFQITKNNLFENKENKYQNNLNEIISNRKKLEHFKNICLWNKSRISVLVEAFLLENYKEKQKISISIKPNHLRKIGLGNDNEEIDIEDNDDYEYSQKDIDEATDNYTFYNPIAARISENRSQIERKERKNKISNYRKTLDIYSNEEASVYQQVIADFLKENKDFLNSVNADENFLKDKEELDED